MACGSCSGGRQYSSRSVRRIANGVTRRRSVQSSAVVFSERDHGGYRLQVTSQSADSLSTGNENGDKKYAE